MKFDAHERARQLIACSGPEEIAEREGAWLREHLNDCEACYAYAEATRQLVRSVRSVPVAADHSLVRATQRRVRQRARELQEWRERMAFIALSTAVVVLLSAASTTVLWQAFAWFGNFVQWPTFAWAIAFVLFWIAPSIAASLMFLAHGTHLSSKAAE